MLRCFKLHGHVTKVLHILSGYSHLSNERLWDENRLWNRLEVIDTVEKPLLAWDTYCKTESM